MQSKCLSLFQIIINLSALRLQHPPSFGGVALAQAGSTLLRLLRAFLFPALCLVVMIMLLDPEWLVLLLVTDSGHGENWSFQIQKLILHLHQSRQTLSRPGLWGCTTKGTVPSDGLMLVSSDAHTESGQAFASKLQKDHMILFWPATPLYTTSYLIPAMPPPTFCLDGDQFLWSYLLSAHHTPLSSCPGTSLA